MLRALKAEARGVQGHRGSRARAAFGILPALALMGCGGDTAPVTDRVDATEDWQDTGISIEVVDSVSGAPVSAEVVKIRFARLFPRAVPGEPSWFEVEVPPDGPQEIRETLAEDSLVIAVEVQAEGYGPSDRRRFRAVRGEILNEVVRLGPLEPEPELAVEEAARATRPPAPRPDPQTRRRSRVVQPPPEPGPGLRSARFETRPAGARVRLRDMETGAVLDEGRTPATLQVPPGVYQWEVELDGYVEDRSYERPLDLENSSSATIRRTLLPLAWQAQVTRGDEAYNAQDCSSAIRLYTGLDRPAQLDGRVGTIWAGTRLNLGLCYDREREFDRAVAAFSEVLQVLPGQWSAKYHLGRLSCTIGEYKAGRSHFSELEGPFLGRISADLKGTVQALARYGSARCLYQELLDKSQPERHDDLRFAAISGFQEFILRGADLVEKGVPANLRTPLDEALADARSKQMELTAM